MFTTSLVLSLALTHGAPLPAPRAPGESISPHRPEVGTVAGLPLANPLVRALVGRGGPLAEVVVVPCGVFVGPNPLVPLGVVAAVAAAVTVVAVAVVVGGVAAWVLRGGGGAGQGGCPSQRGGCP
jgi:hypothetical protein